MLGAGLFLGGITADFQSLTRSREACGARPGAEPDKQRLLRGVRNRMLRIPNKR